MAIRRSRIFPFFPKALFQDMKVRKRTNGISKAYRNAKEDNSNLRLTDASEFIPSVGRLGLERTKMNIKVYSDNINEHQRRHLIDAIHTVNGARNRFFLSKDVREIDLPGGEEVDPENTEKFIIQKYQNDDFKICITARPLSDDRFSHEYRLISIISISDWERVYAPPSLRCYLVYELAQALLSFASDLSEEMALRLVHEPPRGCIMDFCDHKSDIKLGMVAGNLCLDCRGALLRYGTPEEALGAIERILKFVRAEAIGRPILTKPDYAFIVMRFTQNDENDNAYKYGIKPGLETAGIQVERSDTIVTSSQILDKIRKYIDRSRFIIAKVDENNLNVYFELGLAMGADKEVLLISERDLILDLPSDLKNWECLTYTKGDYEELKEKVPKFFEDNYGFEKVI